MKRITSIFAGIALVFAVATTQQDSDSFIPLRNLTSAPATTSPAGKALLFIQNGQAKQLLGTTVTNLGSGGGSGEFSTIWPPTKITNPSMGMIVIGPMMSAYLPADTVFQAAQRVPPADWRYFTLSKRPFP